LAANKHAIAMLKKIIRIITFFCYFSHVALAQMPDTTIKLPFPARPYSGFSGKICGTDLLLSNLRLSPAYQKAEEKMNQQIAAAVRLLDDDSMVLPVVFHILADDPYTIPDQEIINSLADLNDAFAKRGSWTASKGVDTKIRFCLARKDPEGGNATGITRVVSHWGNHVNPLIEDAKMKATAQWDPSRYINIWYVRKIEQEGIVEFSCGVWTRGGVGGYATMPPGGGQTDGVVITGFGLLLAHEMGHYLGLYHTFEGYCNNNNCTLNGDRVCDTPPDGSYRYSPCSNPENSCNTDTLSNYSNGNFKKDVVDPIENIMDYGDSTCQNTFTQGQADRMVNAINTQRKGLLEPKCERPCSEMVVASFRRNIVLPVQGDEVEFTNTSTGSTSYQWLVDGIQVSTSQNFRYTFSSRGRFRITLKAFKSNNCLGSFSEYVLVNCGVEARFYTNKHLIASQAIIYQDTINFTNNSYGATDYKWLMGNDKGMAEQVVSTNRDLPYMFPLPANYSIRLIASNGQCADTTLPYLLNVQDPTADAALNISAVHCFDQTKIKVEFYVCNWSYDTIPAGTPVSFYDADPRLAGAKKIGNSFLMPAPVTGNCCSWTYTHLVEVGSSGLDQIFVVLNDNGTTIPLQLPNTGFAEKSYTNNIQVSKNLQFRVIPLPASVTMEPGDTFRLSANGTPTSVLNFRWSTAEKLSCTNCVSPFFYADTNRLTTKRVIGTSVYSCYDTAYITVLVPPYNDFRTRIDSAECAGSDSLRVSFALFNDFKRGILPKGLTVRFYAGNPATAGAVWLPPAFILKDTVKVKEFNFTTFLKSMPSGDLYAMVNDSAGTPPIVLPNTWLEEKNYDNNNALFSYQRLKTTVTPLLGLIEPYDTLQLSAIASPGIVKSFTWSPAYNLNCTVCTDPVMIADTTTIKRVIAENTFACRDTAFLDVIIPPSDDFTISLDDAECAANDSMQISFTLQNLFRRGVLLKGLSVRFYDKDPRLAGAAELLPAYMLSNMYPVRSRSFTTRIKNSSSGKLFAVVNDSGTTKPLVLPNSKQLEKDYGNNVVEINYAPEVLLLSPQDTIVFRSTFFPAKILSVLDNPASTRWQTGTGYTLSCTQCVNPIVGVTQSSSIPLTSVNKYGCILNGVMRIQILPPDFTITITNTECITNQSTRVYFTVCMNNRYDTLWKGIPLSFYEGKPGQSDAKLLQSVFLTPAAQPGNCGNFQHLITTPSSNQLFAIINDRGIASTPGPDTAYEETNSQNNTVEATGFRRFRIGINPPDTTIERASSIQLITMVEGGSLLSVKWSASRFLSCTDCTNPTLTPAYTDHYMVTGKNEFNCTDTGLATIRTITIGDIHIPSAFTPDGDNLNDIFYVMGSERISILKDFIIYTRWGDKVFEAHNIPPNDPLFGWNGLNKAIKAEPGVYVYQVLAIMKDGKAESRKGPVTLIR
jgi:hypothetical protein